VKSISVWWSLSVFGEVYQCLVKSISVWWSLSVFGEHIITSNQSYYPRHLHTFVTRNSDGESEIWSPKLCRDLYSPYLQYGDVCSWKGLTGQ